MKEKLCCCLRNEAGIPELPPQRSHWKKILVSWQISSSLRTLFSGTQKFFLHSHMFLTKSAVVITMKSVLLSVTTIEKERNKGGNTKGRNNRHKVLT